MSPSEPSSDCEASLTTQPAREWQELGASEWAATDPTSICALTLTIHGPVGGPLPTASAAGGDTTPPGEHLDQLRLAEPLARGGSATVFAGHQIPLDRVVAVKRLHGDADTIHRTYFRAEGRVTAWLEHPAIVPVHERLGEHLVMKRLHGRTLAAWRHDHQEDPADLVQAIGHLLRIGEALGLAHEHGVVHRDLKTENIMVGDLGAVHLLDWGLAAAIDERAEGRALPLRCSQDACAGTPRCLPPEAARGDWRQVGPATDVFLLAATAYELLTGRPLYLAPTLPATLQQAARGHIEPAPEDPWGLWPVLAPRLATEPADRGDLATLLGELRHWRQAVLAAREAEALLPTIRATVAKIGDAAPAEALGRLRGARRLADRAVALSVPGPVSLRAELATLRNEVAEAQVVQALRGGDLTHAEALASGIPDRPDCGAMVDRARRDRLRRRRQHHALQIGIAALLVLLAGIGAAFALYQRQETNDYRARRAAQAEALLTERVGLAEIEQAAGLAPWHPPVRRALGAALATAVDRAVRDEAAMAAAQYLHRLGELDAAAAERRQPQVATLIAASRDRERWRSRRIDQLLTVTDQRLYDRVWLAAVRAELGQWQSAGSEDLDHHWRRLGTAEAPGLRRLGFQLRVPRMDEAELLAALESSDDRLVQDELALALAKRRPDLALFQRLLRWLDAQRPDLLQDRRLWETDWRSYAYSRLAAWTRQVQDPATDPQEVEEFFRLAWRCDYTPQTGELWQRWWLFMADQRVWSHDRAGSRALMTAPLAEVRQAMEPVLAGQTDAATTLRVGFTALERNLPELAVRCLRPLADRTGPLGAVARLQLCFAAADSDDRPLLRATVEAVWQDVATGRLHKAVPQWLALQFLRPTVENIELNNDIRDALLLDDRNDLALLLHERSYRHGGSDFFEARVLIDSQTRAGLHEAAAAQAIAMLEAQPRGHFLYGDLAMALGLAGHEQAADLAVAIGESILPRDPQMLWTHVDYRVLVGDWHRALSRYKQIGRLHADERRWQAWSIWKIAVYGGLWGDAFDFAQDAQLPAYDHPPWEIDTLVYCGAANLALDHIERLLAADRRSQAERCLRRLLICCADARRRRYPNGERHAGRITFTAWYILASNAPEAPATVQRLLAELRAEEVAVLPPATRHLHEGLLAYLADRPEQAAAHWRQAALPYLWSSYSLATALYEWASHVESGRRAPLPDIDSHLPKLPILDLRLTASERVRFLDLCRRLLPPSDHPPADLQITPLEFRQPVPSSGLPRADAAWDYPPHRLQEFRALQRARREQVGP